MAFSVSCYCDRWPSTTCYSYEVGLSCLFRLLLVVYAWSRSWEVRWLLKRHCSELAQYLCSWCCFSPFSSGECWSVALIEAIGSVVASTPDFLAWLCQLEAQALLLLREEWWFQPRLIWASWEYDPCLIKFSLLDWCLRRLELGRET